MTRFRFVSEYAEIYGVTRLCRTLHVSRSAYWDWETRAISEHAKRDEHVGELIGSIHRNSRATYGSPRIQADPRRYA